MNKSLQKIYTNYFCNLLQQSYHCNNLIILLKPITTANIYIIAITWYQLFHNLLQWQNEVIIYYNEDIITIIESKLF